MNFDALRTLGAAELSAIAQGLVSGRLSWPPTELALGRLGVRSAGAFAVLRELAEAGTSPTVVSAFSAAMAAEKSSHGSDSEKVDLVWSGPDLPGHPSRDTGTVVRELFLRARQRVLLVGYAVHRGSEIFATLARRMDEVPSLTVRMCLDIQRQRGDTTRAADLVARFAERFCTREWPNKRFPEVYFDPRSLDLDPARRASLHAKCIVVDGTSCLITSANFTPAAQERNIELGVYIESASHGGRLDSVIEQMISANLFVRVIL